MKQFPNQQNIRCNLLLETSRNFFKIFDSYHRYFFINSQVKRANETPLFQSKVRAICFVLYPCRQCFDYFIISKLKGCNLISISFR